MTENSVIVAVVAKDDVVVRSSCRLWGETPVTVTRQVKVGSVSRYENKIALGVAAVVEGMISANLSGIIVVADKVLPRLLQAKKMTDRHNAADIMILPWMKADGVADEYRAVFEVLLRSLRRAKIRNLDIRFTGSLSLFKVKVNGGSDIPDGMIVDIRQGMSDIWGCTVDNSKFFGSVKILKIGGAVWGEVMPGSLVGKAAVVNERGRIAVANAMEGLRNGAVKAEAGAKAGAVAKA